MALPLLKTAKTEEQKDVEERSEALTEEKDAPESERPKLRKKKAKEDVEKEVESRESEGEDEEDEKDSEKSEKKASSVLELFGVRRAEKVASAAAFMGMPPHFNENSDANTSGGVADFVSAGQLMPRTFSRPLFYTDNGMVTPDGNRK